MRRAAGWSCVALSIACIAWWILTAPGGDGPNESSFSDPRTGTGTPLGGTIETHVVGGLATTEVRFSLDPGDHVLDWHLPDEAHVLSFTATSDSGRISAAILEDGDARRFQDFDWLEGWQFDDRRIYIAFSTGNSTEVAFSYMHPVPFVDAKREVSYRESLVGSSLHDVARPAPSRWDIEIMAERPDGFLAPTVHGGLVLSDVQPDRLTARGYGIDVAEARLTWEEPVRALHVEARCDPDDPTTGILLVAPTVDRPVQRHISFVVDPRVLDGPVASAVTAATRSLEATATWDIVVATDPPSRPAAEVAPAEQPWQDAVDLAAAAGAARSGRVLAEGPAVWEVVWVVDGENRTGRPSSFSMAGAVVHVVAFRAAPPGTGDAELEVVPDNGRSVLLQGLGSPVVFDFQISVEGLGERAFSGEAPLLREGQTRIAGFEGAWWEDQPLHVHVAGTTVDGAIEERHTFRKKDCAPSDDARALAAREGEPTRDMALERTIVTPWSSWELVLAGTQPPVVLGVAPDPLWQKPLPQPSFWYAYRFLAIPFAFTFAVLAFVLLSRRDRQEE